MTQRKKTKPGYARLPERIRNRVRLVVDEFGMSGASRKLDVPLGTIRSVINGVDEVRPMTLYYLEAMVREYGEKQGEKQGKR